MASLSARRPPRKSRGAPKLRGAAEGRSRLVDAKRFFAHRGLAVDKARGLEVEDFGGGIVGFRLPEAGAGEAEAPPKAAKAGGRRKSAG